MSDQFTTEQKLVHIKKGTMEQKQFIPPQQGLEIKTETSEFSEREQHVGEHWADQIIKPEIHSSLETKESSSLEESKDHIDPFNEKFGTDKPSGEILTLIKLETLKTEDDSRMNVNILNTDVVENTIKTEDGDFNPFIKTEINTSLVANDSVPLQTSTESVKLIKSENWESEGFNKYDLSDDLESSIKKENGGFNSVFDANTQELLQESRRLSSSEMTVDVWEDQKSKEPTESQFEVYIEWTESGSVYAATSNSGTNIYGLKHHTSQENAESDVKVYKNHKILHSTEKPYRVYVYSKDVTRSGHLHKHKSVHSTEKPYKCDVCSKGFTQSGQLQRHKRIHTKEKPYTCDVCSKCFTQRSHLQQHKITHTMEKPYKCDVCSKCFTRRGYLKEHKRLHTLEKPYSCDVCSKGFTQSCNLQRHKRTHTMEKPYSCDVCSKGFTGSSDLKLHKRIHTMEKPYSCDVCSKGFTRSSDLQRHKRIHTMKPYSCDVCSKGFTGSSHLQEHKRIHTMEKPYSCDVCSKCFTQSSHLQRHKRTHTMEKPYSCDVCSKGFIQSSDLQRHKRIHT